MSYGPSPDLPEHLKSLWLYVGNVVDEHLHDLDPLHVRARRRCEAALARGRQVKEYDIGSPLYGCPPWDQMEAA